MKRNLQGEEMKIDLSKNEMCIKTFIRIISILIIVSLKNILYLDASGLFYASITSVVVTTVGFETLLKNSKERLFGTIAGGMIGIILFYINFNIYLSIIIGITTVTYITEKFLKVPSPIACIVFLIIILGNTRDLYYLYALKRILQTCLGIFITVLVAYISKKIKLI